MTRDIPVEPSLETNAPALWLASFPWPKTDGHKHSRGRLGVVSGAPLKTGAARLAARGGLRIGAGTVRMLATPEAATVLAPSLEAVMLFPFGNPDQLAELAEVLDAVVIGPSAGLDHGTIANLEALQTTGAALVVDADALSIFKGRPDALFALLDRDDVITPHEGEFERLFPGLLSEGRPAAAAEAARRTGCVVVLKGAETLIATPDGRMRRNPNGSPWLATAGSGDVLAGMIGGLMAQSMPSFEAASAGVWLHAAVGRAFGPGLRAEDLPDGLPAQLRLLCDMPDAG